MGMVKVALSICLVVLAGAVSVTCSNAEPTATPTVAPTATPSPTPSPVPTPEPTAAPIELSAEEILLANVAKLLEVPSFHYQYDVEAKVRVQTISLTVPMTVTGDYQAPDRLQASLSATIAFVELTSELVRVGDATYFKLHGSEEWKVGMVDGVFFLDPRELVLLQPKDLNNLQLVAVTTLDGVSAFHLTGTLDADRLSGATGEFDVAVWVGVDEGLVLQVTGGGEVSLDDVGEEFFGGRVNGTAVVSVTLTLSDFGKDVSIEAPVSQSGRRLDSIDSLPGTLAMYSFRP